MKRLAIRCGALTMAMIAACIGAAGDYVHMEHGGVCVQWQALPLAVVIFVLMGIVVAMEEPARTRESTKPPPTVLNQS